MKTSKSISAVTLLEMLVVFGIVTIALGATLRAIGSVQFLRDRSADVTSLSLRANAELEKLKVQPFDNIKPGQYDINDLPEDQSGKVTVTELRPGELKQVTVTIKTFTAKDSDEITVTTLLSKPAPR